MRNWNAFAPRSNTSSDWKAARRRSDPSKPHAVREFRNPDLAWLIHRQIYTRQIDVLQLEYTVMGQYAGQFRRIPSMLFEHDVYFQSIARRLPYMRNFRGKDAGPLGISALAPLRAAFAAQAGSNSGLQPRQREYIASFLPQLRNESTTVFGQASITCTYRLPRGRTRAVHDAVPGKLPPSSESGSAALVCATRVSDGPREPEPRARLVVIGSDPPPRHSLPEAKRSS